MFQTDLKKKLHASRNEAMERKNKYTTLAMQIRSGITDKTLKSYHDKLLTNARFYERNRDICASEKKVLQNDNQILQDKIWRKDQQIKDLKSKLSKVLTKVVTYYNDGYIDE